MKSLLSRNSQLIPYLLLFVQIAAWTEMDLFAPSLPYMLKDFNTTEGVLQWTFSINFLGFFISSLIVGPLSDAFGRRKILLYGSLIFSFGALISFLAKNINIFLLGRLIQGIGVSAPAVVCMAILCDLFTGKTLIKTMSLINSIVTITMAIAPLFGGFLTSFFGWRATFGTILLLSLLGTIIIFFFIPETIKIEDKKQFKYKNLLYNYKTLILHKKYIFPSAGLSFLCAPYFVFIASISLIFIDELGLSMSQYVYYQGSVVGVFALFSLLSPKIIKHINAIKLNLYSIVMSVSAGVLLALHGIFLLDNPLSITILMCFYVLGIVLPCTIMYVEATESLPQYRASAASLFQAIRLLLLSFGTYLTGLFYNETYGPIGLITGILCIFGFILMLPSLKTMKTKNYDEQSSVHF